MTVSSALLLEIKKQIINSPKYLLKFKPKDVNSLVY